LDTVLADGDGAILDSWEAAVPDDTWQLVEDFLTAEDLLIKLKDTDPNTTAGGDGLVDKISSAEAAWVSALVEEDEQTKATRDLEQETGALELPAEIAGNQARNLSLYALRGDA
jgi:hypothetical protein